VGGGTSDEKRHTKRKGRVPNKLHINHGEKGKKQELSCGVAPGGEKKQGEKPNNETTTKHTDSY